MRDMLPGKSGLRGSSDSPHSFRRVISSPTKVVDCSVFMSAFHPKLTWGLADASSM